MTVDDLEHYLRFTKRTIYRLVKKGDIPAIRVGREWRFDKGAIDLWLQQNTTGAKACILVIDDDPAVNLLFRRTLERAGHQVITAETGAEGIQLVKQRDFSLVFLDLWLPDIEGAEVLEEFRRIKPDLKITVITGYPDSDILQRALEQGPFGVMNKPFDTSDIRTAVNKFLFVSQLD